MTGMNADSELTTQPTCNYRFMPNELPQKVDKLTLDFFGNTSDNFTYTTLDKDGVTIEQHENSVRIPREIAIKIAEFITNGYDNPNIK